MSGLTLLGSPVLTETHGASDVASLDHHGPHCTLGSKGGGEGKKLFESGVVKSASGLLGVGAPGAGALVERAVAWSKRRSRKAAKLG